jgi:hypothetical protein
VVVRGKESERVATWGDLEGKERKEDSRLEPRYSHHKKCKIWVLPGELEKVQL